MQNYFTGSESFVQYLSGDWVPVFGKMVFTGTSNAVNTCVFKAILPTRSGIHVT
jgi:hypothetical protein